MKTILAWLVVLWIVLFMLLPVGFNCYFFVNLVYSLIATFGDVARNTIAIWGTIVCIVIGFGLLGSD